MCHSASVCNASSVQTRRKRAAPASSTSSGAAFYSVANVANAFFNLPPYITSVSSVTILKGQVFTFTVAATDPEGDNLYYVLDSTMATLGSVTLALDGSMYYASCVTCLVSDTVYFTVWENRTDGQHALSVSGHLTVEISDINVVPSLLMIQEGRNINPPTSIIALNLYEFSSGNSSFENFVAVFASYDVNYYDKLAFIINPPTHGRMEVYRRESSVDVIPQDCSQTWQKRRSAWDKVTDSLSSHAGVMQKIVMPNPCGTDLVNRKLAWTVCLMNYTPAEDYFGADTIKVIIFT